MILLLFLRFYVVFRKFRETCACDSHNEGPTILDTPYCMDVYLGGRVLYYFRIVCILVIHVLACFNLF